MGGPFEVKTTFSDGAIETIEVGENNETLMVGTEAIRILSEKIVANQSLGVDTVSGATYSSLASVSYTHLDVYKRQLPRPGPLGNGNGKSDPQCLNLLPATISGNFT